jgi:lauroyl/myristoyl acyltransferase
MPYPNPMNMYGYTVIATATYLRPFEWAGKFTATKEGDAPISEANLAIFPTRSEAEQQALVLARARLWRFRPS